MTKELEERLYSIAFSSDCMSRKEFNDRLRNFVDGEELYKTAKKWWKKGYLALNAYGYVTFTKKCFRHIMELEKCQ